MDQGKNPDLFLCAVSNFAKATAVVDLFFQGFKFVFNVGLRINTSNFKGWSQKWSVTVKNSCFLPFVLKVLCMLDQWVFELRQWSNSQKASKWSRKFIGAHFRAARGWKQYMLENPKKVHFHEVHVLARSARGFEMCPNVFSWSFRCFLTIWSLS